MRFLLRRVLERGAGLEVLEASSGREALSLLDHSQTPPLDLVVLDIQMPGVDGWQVLQHLRSRPRTRNLAVVMCTVRGRAADQLRGWELGADGYLVKPFDLTDLLGEIKQVLARTPEQRQRVRAAEIARLRRRLATRVAAG